MKRDLFVAGLATAVLGATLVTPGACANASFSPDTIFGNAKPAAVASNDGNAINLGVRFQADMPGWITGIRFYKAAINTGTHVVALWTKRGAELASAKASGGDAFGWQDVKFRAAVRIGAGATYVASYYAPHGHYSYNEHGLRSPVSNGPLRALGGTDGVYTYASRTIFPTRAYESDNYWVDVDFMPAGARSTPVSGGPSATVTSPGSSGGRRTLNCFASPMLCGYPDPAAPAGSSAHVGPAQSCASMTQVGDVTTSSSGQTIQDETINGMLYVDKPDVTIDNVCVITPDSDSGPSIYLEHGADNTVVENTSAGAADSDSSSMESAIYNWSSEPATMDDDYFYNCGECIHDGSETVSDSYVIANGMDGTDDHREAVYDSGGPLVFEHDTMFVAPEDTSQVAVFFTSNSPAPPAGTTLEVQDSLLAGGDYVYEGGSTVTSDFTDDHFARCTTGPLTETSDGGRACNGYTGSSSEADSYTGDANGYWPNVGVGGIAMNIDCSSPDVWSANVYDDNGTSVRC